MRRFQYLRGPKLWRLRTTLQRDAARARLYDHNFADLPVAPKQEYHGAMQNAKLNSNQAGVGKLTLGVFGLIIFVVLYVAYHVLPFYYYFYELQGNMDRMVTVASVENDKTIRQRLLYQIHWMQIPARDEDLILERIDARRIKISLKYKEVFFIRWGEKDYVIREFPFHAYAESAL